MFALFMFLAAACIVLFLTGGLLDIHWMIVLSIICGLTAWGVFTRFLGP